MRVSSNGGRIETVVVPGYVQVNPVNSEAKYGEIDKADEICSLGIF